MELEVKIRGGGLVRRAMMKFTIVRASSPYNIILGCTGMRELRDVSSIVHSMIKFPTPKGIATLVARASPVYECRWSEWQVVKYEENPEAREHEEPEGSGEEEVMVNPAHPEQKITIGTQFSSECRRQLISLLKSNMDVFSWQPSDMVGVPRRTIKHPLNVNMSLTPVAQKRRVLGIEKSRAVMKEVEEWVGAGIVSGIALKGSAELPFVSVVSIKVLILVSMEGRNNFNLREENTNRGNLEELRAVMKSSKCPKVSNSSPLVSPSTTISVPRELYSIDVAATFGVPLTTVGDLHKLINDIEAGKHDELLSEMTNDDRMETLDALVNILCWSCGASAKDQPKVNSYLRTLVADPVFDGANISIPRKIVKKAEKDYDESKGFFFFKVDSRAGLEAVMEGGPWLIRKSLIILKKWSMDTRLLKEELTRIPIWVKLHDVPIQVFEEDGISLIAKFIGKPVMLDFYTSSMCNESWGRSSFARCLIEVNSEAGLVDVVTIGIPSLYGDGFTKETIHVEYEWKPPRCDICKIFGHVHDHYPKKVVSPPIVTTSDVVTPTGEKTNDDFQTVGKKKKRKGKSKFTNDGQFTGPSVEQNVRYKPKATTSEPKKGVTIVDNTSQSSSMLKTTDNSSKKDNISMSNSFSVLNDEEDVENVYDESTNLIQNTKAGGSSYFTDVTPQKYQSIMATEGVSVRVVDVGVDCQEYQEIELLEDESCWSSSPRPRPQLLLEPLSRPQLVLLRLLVLDWEVETGALETSGVVGVVTRVVAAALAEAIACFDLWVSSKTILERAS
ncbi:zinc knuckle CX2CX4HX4C containing protein [Tanacetum coccineum]